MRTEVVRTEVERLVRQVPFRPFVLNMENGDRVSVEHPENIAFEPANGDGTGSRDFYVLSSSLRYYGTFDAVTGAALLDRPQEKDW